MTVTVNDIKKTPSINVSDIIKTFDDDNFAIVGYLIKEIPGFIITVTHCYCYSQTINKADVIIMIDDITKNYGDNDFNLTAVSSSTFVLTSGFITTFSTYKYKSNLLVCELCME